ncbi:MAG: phosphodiester glycosidase family protein [Oscillospiraceae bacterium]|nr:phosphodiester glycosidase family protein [Oscillospiraceae bacterium]
MNTLTVGQEAGIGRIASVTTKRIGGDLPFETVVIHGDNGMDHFLYSFPFNPQTSNCMPLAYSKRNGFGATVYDTVLKAEERGYAVKAGVNAAFFGMTGILPGGIPTGKPHTSSNIYGGVVISDGRIMQGDNRYGAEWELLFHSDGRTDLVQSRIAYSVAAQDKNLPLGHINMAPNSRETTDSEIYYYDSFCGEMTETKAPGVEVVCEKQNGSELTVGETLVGKVVECRETVSAGGAIGETQFVLHASSDFPSEQYALLRSLAVGDTVEVNATETVASSKTAMETCSSAFVTYGYHIVMDGKNVTDSDRLGYEFNITRAQRTAIGIQADGGLLLVAADGRKPEFPGMTVYELADYMISRGCVTVVDLDGGGSTQVTVENDSGEPECIFDSESRLVANSLLIVARPKIDAKTKDLLRALVARGSAFAESEPGLTEAMQFAKGVVDAETSMPGDYTKAMMRLRKALESVRANV